MMKHWLSITTKSPVYLGTFKPTSSFRATTNVVSGAVIRGCLAEYLRSCGRTEEIRPRAGGTRFGFFRPAASESALSLPLPSTSMECKNQPGFKGSGKKKGHGVVDMLCASLAYREIKESGGRFPLPLRFSCRECMGRLQSKSGYYGTQGKDSQEVRPKRTSRTMVAISRRRRAAVAEMLYSVTALRPGTVFTGHISGDADTIGLVIQALNARGIGALATKGYGGVEAKLLGEEPHPSLPALEDRVNSFNKSLLQVWEDFRAIAQVDEARPRSTATYFSIDLLSPTFLKDSSGVPTLDLEIDVGGTRLQPVFRSLGHHLEGGWSTAWGLPKQVALAVSQGSSYVFKMDSFSDDILGQLKEIEDTGIGERHDEGYGEVLVCHPFHQEVTQV